MTTAHGRAPLLLLAALFGLASYAILSLRAGLDPALPYELVSPRRLVGTVAGAALFWAIVRRLDLSPPALHAGPLRLLATLTAAGAGLLAVRVAFGWLVAAEDVSLAQDLRWTIVWFGYLGLSTGLYLAWRLREPAAASATAAPSLPLDAGADAIDWIVEAVVADTAPADRRALAERLRARAGYAVADPLLAAVDTPRRAAIERIAARLSR